MTVELVDYYSHLGNINDCGTIILVRYRVMSTDPNISVTKQNEASEVDEINENITAQNNLVFVTTDISLSITLYYNPC